MTAFSDETGRGWLPLKYEDGPDFCTVTFATGAAFALTVHPERMKLMEAALSASPVVEPKPVTDLVDDLAKWLHDETAHPESYPDHTWPETDRDDGRRSGGWVKIVPLHAQEYFRDIARRLDARYRSRYVAPVAQEPAWRYEIQHGPDGKTDWAWVYDAENNLVCTAKTYHAAAIVRASSPPATSAGLGADEIAQIIATKCFDPRVIDSSGKPFWKKSQWREAQQAANAILALLSQNKNQS